MIVEIAKEQYKELPPEVEELENLEKEPSIQELYHALKDKLYEKLIAYKEMEEDFYIINRFASSSMLSLLRDSLFHYKDGIVLCERLYLGKACKSQTIEIPTFTDEQTKKYNEFMEYTKSLPATKELSDEEAQKLINELNERKQDVIDNVKPEMKEADVVFYYDEMNAESYPVLPLKELGDITIKAICSTIADFIVSFFNFISYSGDYSEIALVGNESADGDYVDIVAIGVS